VKQRDGSSASRTGDPAGGRDDRADRAGGGVEGDSDDPKLRAMRAVWLTMRDENPPERGLAALMATARAKAEAMDPQRAPWQRLLATLRRPQVFALATVLVLLGGAVVVGRRVVGEPPGARAVDVAGPASAVAERPASAGEPGAGARATTAGAAAERAAVSGASGSAAGVGDETTGLTGAAEAPSSGGGRGALPVRESAPLPPVLDERQATRAGPQLQESAGRSEPPASAAISKPRATRSTPPTAAAHERRPLAGDDAEPRGSAGATERDSSIEDAELASRPKHMRGPARSPDRADRTVDAGKRADSPATSAPPVSFDGTPGASADPAPDPDLLARLYTQCESAARRGDCAEVRRVVGQITRSDGGYRARVAKDSAMAKCLAE
jgi:hypothetical protein